MIRLKVKEKKDYVEYKIIGKDDTLLENLSIINNIINNLEQNYELTYDNILEYINWYRKSLKESSENGHN
jgi:ferric iron reductase protein FhuF